MSKVKLPSRNKTVALPERPKDRNAQTRQRAQEKVAGIDADTRLQQQQLAGQLEAKVAEMTDRQKAGLKGYSDSIVGAARQMAKKWYGPAGSIELGMAKVDEIPLHLTEEILKKFKSDVGMDVFFSLMGSTAGYQTGLALGRGGQELTEDMIETAVALFEGGLRLMAESTRNNYKDQKVIQPAKRTIQ